MFNALTFHRVSRWFYVRKVPLIPRLIDMLIFFFFLAEVPCWGEIGEGTVFTHRGRGVMVGWRVGKRCTIGPFVMTGSRNSYGLPIIEDDVVVGAYTLLLGEITIGRGAFVGAGSVVVEDVPPGGIVVGNPARLVRIDEDRAQGKIAPAPPPPPGIPGRPPAWRDGVQSAETAKRGGVPSSVENEPDAA